MLRPKTGRPVGRPRRVPIAEDGALSLTEQRWQGAQFEAERLRFPRKEAGERRDFEWCPAQEVAAKLGVTDRVVRKWRQDPAYHQAVVDAVAEQISAGVDRKHAEFAAEEAAAKPPRPARFTRQPDGSWLLTQLPRPLPRVVFGVPEKEDHDGTE